MGSLLLSPVSWFTQGFVCAPLESVSPILCKFWQLYGRANGYLLKEGLCHTQVCCAQRPCPILNMHWKDWCWSWSSNTWPPDAKNWLLGKDSDATKEWRQEEEGMTEDEMVWWHHWLNGHEFEQALGVGDGQESLACCNPWGREHNWATELNWLTCCYLREKCQLLAFYPFLQAVIISIDWYHVMFIYLLSITKPKSPPCISFFFWRW